MNIYKGNSIADGIGLGKLYRLAQKEVKVVEKTISQEEVAKELKYFLESRDKTKKNLEELIEGASQQFSEENLAIFEGQILLLEDEELEEAITSLIKEKLYNALWATKAVFDEQINIISSHNDAYLRERAADFKDLRDRFLSVMSGKEMGKLSFDEDVILITGELTPSDTISLDLSRVKGFATSIGGVTSHAAIISRTLGLPALVLGEEITSQLSEGKLAILDSFKKELIVEPNDTQIEEFKEKNAKVAKEKEILDLLKDKPCETKDGVVFNLLANIGTPKDGEQALEFNPQGVGLFRTEFLFMESSQPPSEEEQFKAYSEVVKQYAPRPVTIRTLDIGGDKEIPYLNIPKEENPFLGWRAVRMYEEKSSLIITQFKAILRASVFGMIKIMVPMVISEEEVAMFKNLLSEAKKALKVEGKDIKEENIKVGIMVETPATALITDTLAKEVDFFSLGTNDLTQYTLAVDRGNAKVADLFTSYHPSVLKLIHMTAKAALKEGIEVSVCGEFASDERGSLLIAGMGIKNLSMTASLMLKVKDSFSKVELKDIQNLSEKVLTLPSSHAVVELVDEFRRDHGII